MLKVGPCRLLPPRQLLGQAANILQQLPCSLGDSCVNASPPEECGPSCSSQSAALIIPEVFAHVNGSQLESLRIVEDARPFLIHNPLVYGILYLAAFVFS